MITDKDLKLIPYFYMGKLYSNGMILEIKTDDITINIIRHQANLFEGSDKVEIVGKGNYKGSITLSKTKKSIYITTF